MALRHCYFSKLPRGFHCAGRLRNLDFSTSSSGGVGPTLASMGSTGLQEGAPWETGVPWGGQGVTE